MARFVTRVILRVSVMVQELLTFPEYPVFCGFLVGQSIGFSVMFCSVDRRLSFVFWLLYCRSVFDIQLMIITLVYSNIINLTVHPGLLHISTQTRMRA